MNKTIKVIISIVLCVWIFAMGLEIGAYRERKAINISLSGTSGTPQSSETTTNLNIVINTDPTTMQTEPTSTTMPSTEFINPEIPSTTAPAAEKTTTGAENNNTTAANKESSIPKTNAEIADAFNKAMNATKHSTRNCNAVKNTDVQLQVTDCSVSSLTGMVNSIAQRFTGPETAEYNFVDGKAQTDDGEITIDNDFPPSNRDTTLEEAGIATASSEAYGNGGYKITIKIVPETSSLGNQPKHHASSVGYLDLESLDINGVTFTEANFNYSGATVSICVNSDGLVEKYECVLPLAGTGSGSVKIASASATLEGQLTENWTFNWQ